MVLSRYKVEVWHVEHAPLSSGKETWEVVGESDSGRVVFTCRNEAVALRVQTMLSQDADVQCSAAGLE